MAGKESNQREKDKFMNSEEKAAGPISEALKEQM